jgi:hypothetical protein
MMAFYVCMLSRCEHTCKHLLVIKKKVEGLERKIDFVVVVEKTSKCSELSKTVLSPRKGDSSSVIMHNVTEIMKATVFNCKLSKPGDILVTFQKY